MTAWVITALPWLLLAITLVALARLYRQHHVGAPRRWARLAALLVLQVISSVLLYLTLQPPPRAGVAGQLVVLGQGADQVRWRTVPGARVIALPEAQVDDSVERAPDLATALRRHPGTDVLQLVGDGLLARDRDVALPAQVMLQAATLHPGWIDLALPPVTAPGAVFIVQAQARGGRDTVAELRDPAGQRVAHGTLDAQGRVQLQGVVRGVGHSVFQLRLLDASQHLLDAVPVPVQTVAGTPLRLGLLSAAPGPEVRALRRWAVDAGLRVQASAQAGAGISMGDAAVGLDRTELGALDLLVLDERRLQALSATQRVALGQAVQQGLGLLVRSSGPLTPAARTALATLGLPVVGSNTASTLHLADVDDPALLQARRGPAARDDATTKAMLAADTASRSATLPALQQLDWRADDAQPLLHDAQGRPVGSWRTTGQGRIGYLPVQDSWLLALAGRDDRHAELWSSLTTTLARALPAPPAVRLREALSWSGERVTLCGVQAGARVQAADSDADAGLPLLLDPASGDQHCAGWWPRQPGWHVLQQDEVRQDIYVFDPAQAAVLHRQQVHEAALAHAPAHAAPAAPTPVPMPGPRWPWLLAFVLVSGLQWGLERWRPRVG